MSIDQAITEFKAASSTDVKSAASEVPVSV
jgi:hypothetical protein